MRRFPITSDPQLYELFRPMYCRTTGFLISVVGERRVLCSETGEFTARVKASHNLRLNVTFNGVPVTVRRQSRVARA